MRAHGGQRGHRQAAWKSHYPNAPKDPKDDDDLRDWVLFLKSKEIYVGLYDLADDGTSTAGSARVGDKHRFTKNLMNDTWVKQTALTPQRIGQWLREDRTFKQADSGFEAAFRGKDERLHIAKWMYAAVFRRTSKGRDRLHDLPRAHHPPQHRRGSQL